MAIDSKDDRMGTLAFRFQRLGLRRLLPDTDGSIDVADRAHLARAWSGIGYSTDGGAVGGGGPLGEAGFQRPMRHTHRLLRHR